MLTDTIKEMHRCPRICYVPLVAVFLLTGAVAESDAKIAVSRTSSFKDPNANVEVKISGNRDTDTLLQFYASSIVTSSNVVVNTLGTSTRNLTLFYSGTTSANGCEHNLPLPEAPNGQWAYIVERGSCTFQKKVENAQKLGASAVFILNNVESLYNSNNKTSNITRSTSS